MQTIQELLQRSSILEKLTARAAGFAQITQKVRDALDPAIASHVHVMRYQGGVLVLRTDSASWATGLRFTLPRLRTQLRATPTFQDLREIQLKVVPANLGGSLGA